jgi:hypothetical protein
MKLFGASSVVTLVQTEKQKEELGEVNVCIRATLHCERINIFDLVKLQTFLNLHDFRLSS